MTKTAEGPSTVPARPAQLTLAFLQQVATDAGVVPQQRVEAFSWKALEVGVISEVVGLEIEFEDAARDGGSPQKEPLRTQWIAKFLRPEFPFERMFEVESSFYTGFAPNDQKKPFPFGLPRALFLSKQLIIMERVMGIETFSCVSGCPEDHISNVVAKLAQMHGRFWQADCSALASPAGIGSELTGEAKQEQFPDAWRSYLDDVPLEDRDRERVTRICETLSETPARLARIHNAVADGPSTLIHGDFHTGNLLFGTSSEDPLWLVDWATCGKGNPMRDLAFLFVVGVRSEHRASVEASSLQVYHDVIAQEGVTHLDLDDWKRLYRMCVLNQFLILVVYDSLSKHLASNAKSEKLRQELHAHFREVNVRACLAVVEHFDEVELNKL